MVAEIPRRREAAMSPRAPTPLVPAAALVMAAWLVVACRGAAPPASSQTQPATPAAQPAATATGEEPQCVTSCSLDKPRTVVASISWPLPQPAADRQALATGIASERLDVTTFKDGFSRGVFAQLAPVRENQPFGLAPNAPQAPVPSLRGLSVTRVTTLQEKIASGEPDANAGIMPAAAANDPSRVVVVEIEGLQPGVNYFWRRTPGGPVVRCQAPVCPSDSRSRR